MNGHVLVQFLHAALDEDPDLAFVGAVHLILGAVGRVGIGQLAFPLFYGWRAARFADS